MKNILELNYEELLSIEGGNCPKCKGRGREVGRIIKDNVIWETISSAWEEFTSWFD